RSTAPAGQLRYHDGKELGTLYTVPAIRTVFPCASEGIGGSHERDKPPAHHGPAAPAVAPRPAGRDSGGPLAAAALGRDREHEPDVRPVLLHPDGGDGRRGPVVAAAQRPALAGPAARLARRGSRRRGGVRAGPRVVPHGADHLRPGGAFDGVGRLPAT